MSAEIGERVDELEQRVDELEQRVNRIERQGRILRDPTKRRVLGVLKQFTESPFNDGTLSMGEIAIRDATGFDAEDVAMILDHLKRAEFAVCGDRGWRITEDGIFAL